jgi:hypothetical protein
MKSKLLQKRIRKILKLDVLNLFIVITRKNLEISEGAAVFVISKLEKHFN